LTNIRVRGGPTQGPPIKGTATEEVLRKRRRNKKNLFRFCACGRLRGMSGDTLTTSYQDAEEALSRAKLTAERTERVGAHVLGTLGDQRQQLLGAADGAAA